MSNAIMTGIRALGQTNTLATGDQLASFCAAAGQNASAYPACASLSPAVVQNALVTLNRGADTSAQAPTVYSAPPVTAVVGSQEYSNQLNAAAAADQVNEENQRRYATYTNGFSNWVMNGRTGMPPPAPSYMTIADWYASNPGLTAPAFQSAPYSPAAVQATAGVVPYVQPNAAPPPPAASSLPTYTPQTQVQTTTPVQGGGGGRAGGGAAVQVQTPAASATGAATGVTAGTGTRAGGSSGDSASGGGPVLRRSGSDTLYRVSLSNLTGPSNSQFRVGDQWQIQITGAPNAGVTLNSTQNGGSVSNGNTIGTTDGNGQLTLRGTFQPGDVGAWSELYMVGGYSAGLLNFNVAQSTVTPPANDQPGTVTTSTTPVTSTSTSTAAAATNWTPILLIGGGLLLLFAFKGGK